MTIKDSSQVPLMDHDESGHVPIRFGAGGLPAQMDGMEGVSVGEEHVAFETEEEAKGDSHC